MRFSLSHLSDRVLLGQLKGLVARDRLTTAEMIAHLAEVESRRLYLPAAYSSMFQYCVGELRLSEDAAAKRLQVARVARQLPMLYDALADGRVHLSALVLLAPHLTSANARELLDAATHKSKREVETLLAERFPREDLASFVCAGPGAIAASGVGGAAPGSAGGSRTETPGAGELAAAALGPGPIAAPDAPAIPAGALDASAQPVARIACESREQHAPGHIFIFPAHPRCAPLAPGRFALQATIDAETHELLQRAQDLLGHVVPGGAIPEVLKHALAALVQQLEARKFAKTSCARPSRHAHEPGGRYIPAQVKRAVHARDGGRCTFVAPNGHRCGATRRLEYDHAQMFSEGGKATVENLRLRCRAHNQWEARRRVGN